MDELVEQNSLNRKTIIVQRHNDYNEETKWNFFELSITTVKQV